MDRGTDNKIKPSLPFAKAYDLSLADRNLTSAEKLVMIIVCRYWPNPYWDTNEQIAKDLGFSERYIEKVIKKLADKGYIKRGYAHTTKNCRPHTVRVIVPLCFGVNPKQKIKWIKTEHMDGQQTEQVDGKCPNNSSFLPEQSDDLLERNKKEIEKRNIKATPSPLPADGQAPALLEDRKKEQRADLEKLKAKIGLGGRKKHDPISNAEFERNKQKGIKALLGDKQ